MTNRIRVLRAEKRLTQKNLAQRTGISVQTINNIENGRCEPTAKTISCICSYFCKPVEEVFKMKEDETND